MLIIQVILGVVALIASRQLYWLFVGIIGSVIGFVLATQFLQGQSDLIFLLVALGSGIVGMLLAFAVQEYAVTMAGFVAGGYLAYSLANALNLGIARFTWPVFIVGGLVGAVLIMLFFNWTLIILSSLTGATLIVQSTTFNQQTSLILLIALSILGIAIQFILWQQEKPVRT